MTSDKALGSMRLAKREFAINTASFRFVTDSISGPGWDFSFGGQCVNGEDGLFPFGARLYTEAAPLPLANTDDLTGAELECPLPYDEETGEPLFGFKVMEEHDVFDLCLRFGEKRGNSYRIELNATVSETVLGYPEKLAVSAWAERLADHAYPA